MEYHGRGYGLSKVPMSSKRISICANDVIQLSEWFILYWCRVRVHFSRMLVHSELQSWNQPFAKKYLPQKRKSTSPDQKAPKKFYIELLVLFLCICCFVSFFVFWPPSEAEGEILVKYKKNITILIDFLLRKVSPAGEVQQKSTSPSTSPEPKNISPAEGTSSKPPRV